MKKINGITHFWLVIRKLFLTRSFCTYLFALSILMSCQEDSNAPLPNEVLSPPEIVSFSPISGKVGDEIIIEGNNFSPTLLENEVRLNNVKSVVTSATVNQLKITVPSGATSGKLSVSVNGFSIASSNDFTVVKEMPRLGLVAYFPFNGNANDESGNDFNGIINGAVLGTDRFGNENSCYSFDGIDDYIFIGNPAALQISRAITISAWTKIQGTPFSVYLLSKIGVNTNGEYEGYNFITYKNALVSQYSHGLVLSGTPNGLIYAEGSWLPDQWVFTTVSQEDDHCKIYVNGIKVLDKFGAKSLKDIDPSIGNLIIGKSSVVDLENPFQGSIDEVSIYNRSLTDEEVKALYEISS